MREMGNRLSDVDCIPMDGNQIVTPVMAKEWLDLFYYKHQRRIRPYHVKNLKQEILNNRFREKTQIGFCEFAGWYYLVNGYHTLNALIEANCSILLNVAVNKVSSIDDVAAEYSRHDTHLTRPLSDALAAYEVAEKNNLTKTQVGLISAAAIYLAGIKGEIPKKSSSQLSNDDKVEITNNYINLGKKALWVIKGNEKKNYFKRKSTLGTIMLCLEAAPNMAENFWVPLVEDDGLRKGDPRKTLLSFLQESGTTGGGFRVKINTKKYTEHELIKAIARAWNAFYDRRELKIIRYNFEDKTVTLKGVGTFNA